MEFDLQEEIKSTNPQDIDVKLVKSYMRIDFEDAEDTKMIEIFLQSAKSFTQSYLKWRFESKEDIPEEITIAILAITEHWYKNRGVMSEDSTAKELPYVFSGILDMHRNYNIGFAPEAGDVNGTVWTT